MRQVSIDPAGSLVAGVTLQSGFDALLECQHELEHCIAAAHRNPSGDRSVLAALEREKGRLTGELLRYDGLFRTLSRGRRA